MNETLSHQIHIRITYTSSYRKSSQYKHLDEYQDPYQVHVIMAIEVSCPRNERVPASYVSIK